LTRQNGPIRRVTLPDEITFDMVTQALKALGLERGNSIEVDIVGDEVTVRMGMSGGYGSIGLYLLSDTPLKLSTKQLN